jgi:hypothetical protein
VRLSLAWYAACRALREDTRWGSEAEREGLPIEKFSRLQDEAGAYELDRALAAIRRIVLSPSKSGTQQRAGRLATMQTVAKSLGLSRWIITDLITLPSNVRWPERQPGHDDKRAGRYH